MRAHLIRALHHTRRGLFYTLAAAVILMAVVVAIADRLLPLVQEHPDRIAAWLMQRSGRPVKFSHAEAHWTSRGPLFTLYDLRIGKGDSQLAVDRAELLLAMYSGALPGHPFTELRLRGLALSIERDADGRWRLVGLATPKQAQNTHPLATLEGLGELQVTDARVSVRVPSQGFQFVTPNAALRLRVTPDRLRAGLRVDAGGTAPLQAVVDFDRRKEAGRLWIGSDDFDLAPWARMLTLGGVRADRGRGRLQLWGGIADRRLESVQVEAALRGVGIVAAPEAGAAAPMRVDLADVTASARLRRQGDGWTFVAPRLRVRSQRGAADVLDGLAMRLGPGLTMVAPRLDVGALLEIGLLAEQVPPGLRTWLAQAGPHIRVSRLRVNLGADGVLQGRAHLDDIRWQPVGTRPAIQGLAGDVLFDRQAISLTLDRPDPQRHPLQLSWPPAFGDPVPLQLDGRLTAWRDAGDWVLETSGLHIHNDDLDLHVRLAMRFHGDGRKPRLDLLATVGRAKLVNARHYWLRHKMPPRTVAWLDRAFVGGTVIGGHVLLGGELADWPFRHGQGVFDAVADLDDAELDFDHEWPHAEHLTGQARFDGPGMQVSGTARIAGIDAHELSAAIPDFHQAVLDVRAQATGSGEQMLGLLRASPLKKKFGAEFASLDLRGPGMQGTLHLSLPLHHDEGALQVEGDVDLAHAKLADPRWGVAFSDVGGRVHYDQDGVLAQGLDVKVHEDAAKLRLAIGKATGDPATAVAVSLAGVLPVTSLLEHAPMLGWLKPIVSGRSAWTVDVKVPTAATRGGTAPTSLTLRSDLRGATLALPAPLGKLAAASLPLRISAPLPIGSGDIAVSLGGVLDVRGRYEPSGGFRGLLAFGAPANGPLPASGLIAIGRVATLDVAGWVGFAGGSGESTGLQSVDVRADDLSVGGRHFPATRVRLTRNRTTTSLRLDGDAMAGNVVVPVPTAAGIRAQFERLYWPAAAAGAAAADDKDADTDIDPAAVPPLHLDVADLRFGEARLGHLLLQTHPVAQGMHIDELDARSHTQTIDASGDWLHAGHGGTRTQLSLAFKADSLGDMLDALGFKGVVAAGRTKASLNASWNGSPMAFRLAALDGALDLDVGEGRLLEVKPGAGRILGLVSLAELPRRLSLDFRDFFEKGFGFNTLRGHFVFDDGVAHTDKLSINGPAADIRISGNTDLVRQRYDQTIDVLPKTGGLATVVGAAVAGPVGAAVGAVAGAVLKKPLQHMGHKRYRVTGPWNHPEVKPVPVERGEAEVSGTPAPGQADMP